MRQGRRKTERDAARSRGKVWLRPAIGIAILAAGFAASMPAAGLGADDTAKPAAQAPAVSQATPWPGAIVQGGTIPPGWAPQAVPYQAIGPDGRPVTLYYAPTYVFTYPIGPPVPMMQAAPGASQVNRRQAYGQPWATNQGWNYQTQGARPTTYVPPPTVARYAPAPFSYPPGSAALGGIPIAPPPQPAPFSAPAISPPMFQQPPAFQQPSGLPIPPPPAAPPAQWVPSQQGLPQPPPGIGAAPPNPMGQAFATAAPVAMAGIAAAAAPTASSSPLVPVQPVSSQPGLRPIGGQPGEPLPADGGSAPGRSANSHLWRVVGVHDGDTVTCIDDANQQQKVRLAEIDAPELGQDFGKVSREALAAMVFGKTVEVVDQGKDRYGRWIGRLVVDGQDANRQMVATGNAWHYAAYSQDASLAALEQQARAAKLGLWAQPNPMPPWDYRRNGRQKAGA